MLTIILSEGKIIILYSCIELADWQSDEQRPACPIFLHFNFSPSTVPR